MFKFSKGITYKDIELVVVLVIIGIMVAMAVSAFRSKKSFGNELQIRFEEETNQIKNINITKTIQEKDFGLFPDITPRKEARYVKCGQTNPLYISCFFPPPCKQKFYMLV